MGGEEGSEGSARSAGGKEGSEGSARSAGGEEGSEGSARSAGGEEGSEGSARSAGGEEGSEGSARSVGGEEGSEGSARSAGGEEGSEGSAMKSDNPYTNTNMSELCPASPSEQWEGLGGEALSCQTAAGTARARPQSPGWPPCSLVPLGWRGGAGSGTGFLSSSAAVVGSAAAAAAGWPVEGGAALAGTLRNQTKRHRHWSHWPLAAACAGAWDFRA